MFGFCVVDAVFGAVQFVRITAKKVEWLSPGSPTYVVSDSGSRGLLSCLELEF